MPLSNLHSPIIEITRLDYNGIPYQSFQIGKTPETKSEMWAKWREHHKWQTEGTGLRFSTRLQQDLITIENEQL